MQLCGEKEKQRNGKHNADDYLKQHFDRTANVNKWTGHICKGGEVVAGASTRI